MHNLVGRSPISEDALETSLRDMTVINVTVNFRDLILYADDRTKRANAKEISFSSLLLITLYADTIAKILFSLHDYQRIYE